MDENTWDKLLKIKTMGRDDTNADQYHYPYEPTPYSVLERLANSGEITKKDILMDYGCGKGRVSFFLAYQTRCRTIGVEFDERIYAAALENQKQGAAAGRTSFVCENAAEFQVPENVTSAFFFNPFSVEILQKVMSRILESYYRESRTIRLFFYYPSDEYVAWLMTVEELEFADEIDCRDLFDGNNKRERILEFVIE